MFIYHRKAPKKRKVGGQVLLFAFTHTNAIYNIASDFWRPPLFINKQGSVAKSHSEDSIYLCCFQPINEILMCLYEIFETGKKQDLIPIRERPCADAQGLLDSFRI